MLNISQGENETLLTEVMKFISGLEFTLTKALPQEKFAALRKCIDKPTVIIKLNIRQVPTGNLLDTGENTITVYISVLTGYGIIVSNVRCSRSER